MVSNKTSKLPNRGDSKRKIIRYAAVNESTPQNPPNFLKQSIIVLTMAPIVHNVSNQIITYKKGESFCQVVSLPITCCVGDVEIKKSGKRSSGKLGSTGI